MKHVLLSLSIVVLMLASACKTTSWSTQKKDLIGTWKMIALKCDTNGENCKQKTRIVLSYKNDGYLYMDRIKYASYEVKDNVFILTGKKIKTRYVEFKIKNNIMITNEKGSYNHEKLVRQ